MITLSAALHRVITRAERNGGKAGGIYLTRPHTDQLLAEMGMKRDMRFTRTPVVSRFNDVPVYVDRDISMVVCHDQAGEAYPELI